MKILFVSHSSVLKYHQQKLEILAEKFGHDITLITPPYWNEGGSSIKVYTGNGKIKYEIGKTVIFKKRLLHFYMNASDIVKKINPDIVHIEEEPFAPVCWQFMRAAKKMHKKAVFFTWENIERRHNPVYTYFDNYCIKKADAAIAGNEDGKQILLKKGFKGSLEVIPQYGINLEDFPLTAKKNDDKVSNLVYIGRLTPEKGLSTLVESLKDISGIKLHIAGSGSALFTEILCKQVESLGIKDKVILYPFIDREKIPEFLSKMDILILPSLSTPAWKEQFGRVLIEAFAAKVAVIGSDSGEIPHIIADAGLVFREGDAHDLASKILLLIKNPEFYASYLENGYKRVADNYTNDVISGQIDSLYKKITG